MPSEAPSKRKLVKTLRKLENDPKNRVRILGEMGITVVGGALGAAGAGAAAGLAGATAIGGVTSAASMLGISVVSATPIGWIIGGALVGAGAVYGISRLIRGGAYNEGKLRELIRQIRGRIQEAERKERASSLSEDDLTKFEVFLREPLERGAITNVQAHRLMVGVENGSMKISDAYRLLQAILDKD